VPPPPWLSPLRRSARDGKQVGWLTSAGWGYTIGKWIGYGYVHGQGLDGTPDLGEPTSWRTPARACPRSCNLQPL
jgi:glycine cleavage system aminomethyltransferase T